MNGEEDGNISLLLSIDNLFGGLFKNSEITEIVINKFNEIWYENESGFIRGTEEECNRVTDFNCKKFTNCVASYCDQELNAKNPILGTTLPTGERIQIVIPPCVPTNQFSITIRKPMKKILMLDEYEANGFFDNIIIGEQIPPIDIELAQLLKEKNYKAFFKLATECGLKNLAIAGATGSGKTTFFRAVMNEIPHYERLITIEDVRELFDEKHQNVVNLLYPSEVKSSDQSVTPAILLKSCLRMKPDRILLAELRSGEAFDYVNAISSGHGGSITTLHAGSKEEVIRRLTLMTLQNPTGSKLPYETARSIIEDTIDIIIHIGRINGKRGITSLYWKDYEKVNRYLNEQSKD